MIHNHPVIVNGIGKPTSGVGSHTSADTTYYVSGCYIKLIEHPSYSPDLAPHHFPSKIKDVVSEHAVDAFKNHIPESDYQKYYENCFTVRKRQ